MHTNCFPNRLLPLLTLFLLVNINAIASELSETKIEIVTEDYPPYSYYEKDKLKGVSTEVVNAVLDQLIETEVLKSRPTITMQPWARSYRSASTQENVLIFSISRLAEREPLFKWVGVIAPIDFYIFALADRDDVSLNTLEDGKKYTTGVVIDDAQEHFLTSKGFSKLTRLRSHEQTMNMLFAKRVDLWPISEFAGYYYLRSSNHAANSVKKVYHLKDFSSGDQYMAFGAKTSDAVVNAFKKALQAIKDNGRYQSIIDQYR